jgi:hypothetical protein
VAEWFYNNLLEIQAIYHWYFPDYFRPFDLRMPVEHRAPTSTQTASFYSGGVDSLYNLVEMELRREQGLSRGIDQLWLVQGMDICITKDRFWQTVSRSMIDGMRDVLRQEVVTIRTNIHAFYGKWVPWGYTGHGPVLAGIAKSAANIVGSVLIGSSSPYNDPSPWASTPLVDPHWSCDQQSIVHFGARFNRAQKLQTIARKPEYLRSLRVCFENRGGAYNCGRCEKCVRTRLVLMALGLDRHCSTFSAPLDHDDIRRIRLPWYPEEDSAWLIWNDVYKLCRRHPDLKAAARAIRHAMWRSRLCLWRRPFLPFYRALRRRLRRPFAASHSPQVGTAA